MSGNRCSDDCEGDRDPKLEYGPPRQTRRYMGFGSCSDHGERMARRLLGLAIQSGTMGDLLGRLCWAMVNALSCEGDVLRKENWLRKVNSVVSSLRHLPAWCISKCSLGCTKRLVAECFLAGKRSRNVYPDVLVLDPVLVHQDRYSNNRVRGIRSV